MCFRSGIIWASLLLVLTGCQASLLEPDKKAAAAISQQDVIDAWDSVCSAYHFSPCPEGAGEMNCAETMSSMYLGDDFETESDLLMISIQGQVCSSSKANADVDDLLSSVLNDLAWYS